MNINTLKNETYPEKDAIKVWKKTKWQGTEIIFSIVNNDVLSEKLKKLLKSDFAKYLHDGYFTGYARFKDKLFKGYYKKKKPNYLGFLTYIPVHGGITYAKKDEYGYVYGFDCVHSGDEDNPNLKDINYIAKQCELLGDMLFYCKEHKDKYDKANTNQEKSIIIQDFIEKFPQAEQKLNFGALINLIGGKI